MNKTDIESIVKSTVIKTIFEKTGNIYLPVGISNRHLHLCRSDCEKLFGAGYRLKELKALIQPGQYACEETVEIKGPKGTIRGVRVLGPEREETQVEVSVTDSYRLGIEPVVRISGDISGSPGVTVIGPSGSVTLEKGLIISKRHLHVSDDEAEWMGLRSGDIVKASYGGQRALTLGNIPVRSGKAHRLELHLDNDEANAAMVRNGDLMQLVRE